MPVKTDSVSDKTKWVLVGLAAAAAAAGAAYFLLGKGAEDDEDDESSSDEEVEAKEASADAKESASPAKPDAKEPPALSKEQLLEVLDTLFTKTEELHAVVKAKLESQDADATKIQAELEEGMQQIEKEVHDKYDVDQQGLMAARQFYSEDAEVKEQIGRLKRLFQPPESKITVEEFIPKLQEHLDMSFKNVESAFNRVREENLQGEEAMRKMMEYAGEKAAQVQADSLKAIGMSEEDFTAACLKHQSNPRVMQLFQSVMMRQAGLQHQLMG